MDYQERLQKMLSHQYQDDTKERFKNLKNGDVLVLKPHEELSNRDCRAGYFSFMRIAHDKVGKIIFDIDKFSYFGVISLTYDWSLDMMEYDNLQLEVELI